jgi:hypothetical protein
MNFVPPVGRYRVRIRIFFSAKSVKMESGPFYIAIYYIAVETTIVLAEQKSSNFSAMVANAHLGGP